MQCNHAVKDLASQNQLLIHPLQKFAPEAPVPLDEVVDLQQKLAILQQKRQEDKAKIKELEKFRAQLQQVCLSKCPRALTLLAVGSVILWGTSLINAEYVIASSMSSYDNYGGYIIYLERAG